MPNVKPIRTSTIILANILVIEGYVAFKIEDKSCTRRLFDNQEVWWFPEIEMLIGLDSNHGIYVSKLHNTGSWAYKRNRKGSWQRMDEYNPSLVNALEELLAKYVNHFMLEE